MRTRADRLPGGDSLRALGAALFLVLLAACGGGGGGGGPTGPVIIDGLAGTILLPDYDLGRINEQEPNDGPTQVFRLPPVWPRCALEVAGTLSNDASWYGRSDTSDVLAFSVIEAQQVSLELTFQATDPGAPPAPNDFQAEVVRRETGVSLATTAPGGQPHTLVFEAAANEYYDVTIRVDGAGTGWWVARFVCTDLALAPDPKPTPASSALRVASPAATEAAPTRGIDPEQRCAHTHVLVRMRDGCDAGVVCARHGLELGAATGLGSHRVVFDTPSHEDAELRAGALCVTLRDDPDVLWAEPDWVVRQLGEPGDPAFNRQWNLRAVGATSAWDVTKGSPSITIGIVDSGIGDAPDLEGQTVPGFDFVSSEAISGDGDGRDYDPTDPGDRFTASGTSSWHGTHIAGLLVAKHDDQGMAGLVPDCKVMMLRALGIGGGFVSDAADAILYAAGQLQLPDGSRLATPLKLLNLSIGLAQDSTELREACERASNLGMFLVAAVGNGGGAVEYPARYPSTFAVAAVDGHLLTTQYSAFGSSVDIAGPGGGPGTDADDDGWHDGVLSTVKDETLEPAPWSLGYLVGTSQAAPHVVGAAAMLLAIDPTMSAADMRIILRGSALDLGLPGTDVAYGAGLVQLHEAVKIAMGRVGPGRNDAPYLMVPRQTLHFDGLRTTIDVPLQNGGGGTMNVFFAAPETDDGAPWLAAVLDPDNAPGAPVNQSKVTISVDRSQVAPTPGRYSGVVRLGNSGGASTTIRVTMYVQQRTRAGQLLPVVALDTDGDIARRKALAYPESGYRFWLRALPASDYILQAGEDLDLDGFFCEGADACGYHGGPDEMDATIVPYVPGEPAVQGLSIVLFPPP